MKWLLRSGIVLAVLFLLGVAALALMLPRLAKSDAVRTRINEAARSSTGREVGFGDLEVGLIPPRLVVTQARMSGPAKGAPDTLEGADVELRLALLPLLARAVVVDSLVVEGATLRLVRTKDGLVLPEPSDAGAAGGAAPSGDGAAGEEGPGFALAVRHVALRNAHVVFEDRAVSPATTWEVRELEATVRGRSFDDPLDVKASGALASGGRFELEGSVQAEGPFDLALDLDGFVLDPAQPYLAKGQRAKGRVSGAVRAQGKLPDPQAIDLDLRFEEADIAMDDVAVRGQLGLKAQLTGGLETPQGKFSVDATQAALRYGESFEKPAGTQATAEGRIVTGADGAIGVEDTRLRMKNVDARVSVETGKRTRARVSAPAFDLDGWEALLPALRDSPPSGKVGFEDLVLATEPLDVRGAIAPIEVELKRPDAKPLVLRGALVGEGNALRSRDMVLSVGGQSAPLTLNLTGITGTPRLAIQTKLENADTDAWLAALAGQPGVLAGALGLDTELTAPVGGDAELLDALAGNVRFEIRPGQIRGVSLLQSTFERMGALGEAALIAGRLRGGSSLQRFYGDDFKAMSGTLRLGGGFARTDDLRIEYRNYTADLRGSVRLTDLALDMNGKLTIDESIDAVVAGTATAPETGGTPAAIPESAPKQGKRRVIPLARIGGTLDSPKVVISPDAAVEFASIYTLERRREKVTEKIDEKLGEGTGKQVIDALEGLLGGRKRQ